VSTANGSGRGLRAVSQLLWPDKDREVWFSLGENHEKAYRFLASTVVRLLGLSRARKNNYGNHGGALFFIMRKEMIADVAGSLALDLSGRSVGIVIRLSRARFC
jgi:hypothetical protein